nr:hypothetical protein [Tanacetum cinerariifolium]
MAHLVQNINHSAFRSMFEREKLFGNNFNDWFHQLKLVLRVERKLFVIEQAISLASPTDSEYLCSVMRYMIHNEVACLILGIGELHDILIEYENGLPKKAKTPQVMMIKGGKIQKAKKKSLIAKGKGKPRGKGKDKQVYISKTKYPKPYAKEHPAKYDACHHCKEVGHWKRNCPIYLAELLKKKKQVGSASLSNGIYEIDMHDLVPNVNSIYNVSTKRAKHNLDSTYLWHCRLARIKSATRIHNMVPTKKVDKTPYELWYGKVPNMSYLKKNLITQEVSGRAIDLEEIQDEYTSSSKITSQIPMEVEGFKPPQEEVIPICRSERTHRALNHLCLNAKIDAMNAEIQSMIDNMVWVLVDLPANCKTVGTRLVAKGYTQLYEVDYEETFSPVAYIRATMILISIVALYDYEIWQMEVKTAFLNGYLDEDIYMVQPKGFVDPSHPRKVWEATFILGIKIYIDRSKQLIGLGQNAYMDKILNRYKIDNSKRGHIPMQERLDLNKTQGASTPKEVKRMQTVPYASAIGSIMYVVRCTRPDVAFEQNITILFQQNPVDWKSSKQNTTAMSTTEVEYIAASEAVWIRKFISGLGVQRGAKHYYRRYHYVHESIALGEIRFLKVHTDDNLADPFTKALSKGKLTQHARSMGLRLASSFM